ncbi:hypothetical protein NPIL_116911 [Nephila pilipes]|uniref:Uncharacterized protein n=1 Tax=Nephila pilipes TaxID=299642 RepID=A0A8X6KMU8_NEPPI|nr:hypothetical protein NPIL_116911 [Nephila pilipes]
MRRLITKLRDEGKFLPHIGQIVDKPNLSKRVIQKREMCVDTEKLSGSFGPASKKKGVQRKVRSFKSWTWRKWSPLENETSVKKNK